MPTTWSTTTKKEEVEKEKVVHLIENKMKVTRRFWRKLIKVRC